MKSANIHAKLEEISCWSNAYMLGQTGVPKGFEIVAEHPVRASNGNSGVLIQNKQTGIYMLFTGGLDRRLNSVDQIAAQRFVADRQAREERPSIRDRVNAIRGNRSAAQAQEPVGRIEFLDGSGGVAEQIEYTDADRFEQDVVRENDAGAAMNVVLYQDKYGDTIPQEFLLDMNPVTVSVRYETAPKLENGAMKKNAANGSLTEQAGADRLSFFSVKYTRGQIAMEGSTVLC